MMQLPKTQNAHYVHAFKKGYRWALDQKPLTDMPSHFQYDPTLRKYFEQGWSQVHQQRISNNNAGLPTARRKQTVWLLVVIIGSALVISSLINVFKNQQAKPVTENKTLALTPLNSVVSEPTLKLTDHKMPLPSQQAFVLEKPLIRTEAPAKAEAKAEILVEIPAELPTQVIAKKPAVLFPSEPSSQLSEPLPKTNNTSQPLLKTDIRLVQAVLTPRIIDKLATEVFENQVPVQVSNLFFFTQVEGANDQIIYHRWLFKNQEMARIPLKINSNLYRTWSSKRLIPDWQGKWTIEVLNETKEVIHRQTFELGKP